MKIKSLLFSICLMVCSQAYAFTPKNNPITVIIPFAPGGGVDQTFRHFEVWANKKGYNFVAQFKPGADGLIGMDTIASSPKDGYTVSFGTAGTVATQRLKNPNAELIVVTAIRTSITGFVTSVKSNIKSLDELDSRLRSKDGVSIGVGAPGQSIVIDQIIELSKTQEKQTIVNYKGGNPVVVDLVGGHIDLAGVPLNIVSRHIESNKVKLIGVTSDKRLDQYPTVPIINEKYLGYKNLDGILFILPSKVDKSVVDFYTNLLKEYLNDPTVTKDFVKDYYHALPFGQQYAEQLIDSTKNRLSKMIKQ